LELPLTALKNGESGKITLIGANPGRGRRGRGFQKRLMDLGLTPGTEVTVVKSAPFRGPVEIRVRGSFKALPGEPTELIMEMHEYKVPHLKTVFNQTWFRLKEFIKLAFPLIIVSSLVIKMMEVSGFLEPISAVLTPLTTGWLGLRPEMGIALIFGILRKELTLITLATLLGTTNFGGLLTPVQMVVFTLITMLYIPCTATIAALVKEFGWKKTSFITVFEIIHAIFVGGIAFRILFS